MVYGGKGETCCGGCRSEGAAEGSPFGSRPQHDSETGYRRRRRDKRNSEAAGRWIRSRRISCTRISIASRWTLRFASRFRLHVKGEARGVKVDGGILELIMREIEVECLPGDIPERIEIDVTRSRNQRCSARFGSCRSLRRSRFWKMRIRLLFTSLSVKEEAAATPALPHLRRRRSCCRDSAEPEVMKKGKKEEEAACGVRQSASLWNGSEFDVADCRARQSRAKNTRTRITTSVFALSGGLPRAYGVRIQGAMRSGTDFRAEIDDRRAVRRFW